MEESLVHGTLGDRPEGIAEPLLLQVSLDTREEPQSNLAFLKVAPAHSLRRRDLDDQGDAFLLGPERRKSEDPPASWLEPDIGAVEADGRRLPPLSDKFANGRGQAPTFPPGPSFGCPSRYRKAIRPFQNPDPSGDRVPPAVERLVVSQGPLRTRLRLEAPASEVSIDASFDLATMLRSLEPNLRPQKNMEDPPTRHFAGIDALGHGPRDAGQLGGSSPEIQHQIVQPVSFPKPSEGQSESRPEARQRIRCRHGSILPHPGRVSLHSPPPYAMREKLGGAAEPLPLIPRIRRIPGITGKPRLPQADREY
jgi:hypothetical protein